MLDVLVNDVFVFKFRHENKYTAAYQITVTKSQIYNINLVFSPILIILPEEDCIVTAEPFKICKEEENALKMNLEPNAVYNLNDITF